MLQPGVRELRGAGRVLNAFRIKASEKNSHTQVFGWRLDVNVFRNRVPKISFGVVDLITSLHFT